MLKRRIELFLIFIVCASFTYSTYGQTNDKTNNAKYEVGAGAGVLSSDEIFDGSALFSGPKYNSYEINHYSGAYFVTAKYFVGRRVGLGISFAYENESGTWVNVDRDRSLTTTLGTFKRQAFTFAPEIYLNYVNKDLVRLYATFGLGVDFRNEVDKYTDGYYQGTYYNGKSTLGTAQEFNNNRSGPNVYFSPFGMSIGGKVRWFAEIGIGYKGVVNTGISVKL